MPSQPTSLSDEMDEALGEGDSILDTDGEGVVPGEEPNWGISTHVTSGSFGAFDKNFCRTEKKNTKNKNRRLEEFKFCPVGWFEYVFI